MFGRDEQALVRLMEKAVGGQGVPAIARVVRHGAQPGEIERAREMGADSPLLLASITKMVTGAAAHAAIGQGLLADDTRAWEHLDADVRAELDGLPGVRELTVHQLLTQTSGLPDAYESGDDRLVRRMAADDFSFTLQDMARWTAALGQVRVRPGRAHYADVNFDLLGHVLANALGTTWDSAIERLVTGPLGMSATRAPRPGGQVPGIARKGELLHRPEFLRSSGASGGLISSARDMDRLLVALTSGELFAPERVMAGPFRRMQLQMGPIRYGAGVMRLSVGVPMGERTELVGHIGSTGSFAFLAPAKQTTIVGTINRFASGGATTRIAMRLGMRA